MRGLRVRGEMKALGSEGVMEGKGSEEASNILENGSPLCLAVE